MALWFFEAKDRDLERASRISQAVSGAFAVLNESRGKALEIGQSEAFALLTSIGRPPESLNLDDITLRGAHLQDKLVQDTGRLVALMNARLDGGVPSKPHAACVGFVFAVDWVVLDRAQVAAHGLCFKSSAIIFDTDLSGRDVSLLGRNLVSPDVKNPFILAAYGPDGLGSKWDLLKNPGILASIGDLENVNISAANIRIDVNYFTMAVSDAAGAHLTIASGDVLIRRSVLRNATVKASSMEGILINPFRSEMPHPPISGNRHVVLATSDMIFGEGSFTQDDFRFFASFAFSTDWNEAQANRAIDEKRSPFTIINSDIRGADLRHVPKEFLRLANVCADKRTKVAAGVVLKSCGPLSTQFWDRLEQRLGADTLQPLIYPIGSGPIDADSLLTSPGMDDFARYMGGIPQTSTLNEIWQHFGLRLPDLPASVGVAGSFGDRSERFETGQHGADAIPGDGADWPTDP